MRSLSVSVLSPTVIVMLVPLAVAVIFGFAKPKITATASGTSMTITVGDRTLTLSDLTSGEDYVIDCQICEVMSGDGTETLTQNSSGKFPKLMPGVNTITGTGWSSLVIDRRQRFL